MAFSFKWQGINFLLSLRHKFMLAHLWYQKANIRHGFANSKQMAYTIVIFFLAQNVITKSPNLSLGQQMTFCKQTNKKDLSSLWDWVFGESQSTRVSLFFDFN